MVQTKKRPRRGVVVRPIFINGSPAMKGDYYDGPDARYLIGIGKMRPFDPDVETVETTSRDGVEVKVAIQKPVQDKPATAPAAHQDVPGKNSSVAELRAWIEKMDPTVKVPANASKANLLEAVADLVLEAGGE